MCAHARKDLWDFVSDAFVQAPGHGVNPILWDSYMHKLSTCRAIGMTIGEQRVNTIIEYGKADRNINSRSRSISSPAILQAAPIPWTGDQVDECMNYVNMQNCRMR